MPFAEGVRAEALSPASHELDGLAVLIPVFNDPSGLRATLQSIREICPVRVLVVDDGSDTPINGVAWPGLDLRVIRLPENAGIERALNFGLSQLRVEGTKIVARLDAGDLAAPGRFGRQFDFMTKNPEVVLVGGQARVVDEDGVDLYVISNPTSDRAIRNGMYRNNMFVHTTAAFRLDAAVDVGLYPFGFPAKEDHEFFWRLLEVGEGANLESVEAVVELATDGVSVRRRRRQQLTGIHIIRRRWRSDPVRASVGIARNLILVAVPIRVANRIKARIRRPLQRTMPGRFKT